MDDRPGGMTAFSAKRRRAAEVRVSAKILASRMTSFAFVVRNGAIAPFRPLRQAG